jgi:hypothetical protein
MFERWLARQCQPLMLSPGRDESLVGRYGRSLGPSMGTWHPATAFKPPDSLRDTFLTFLDRFNAPGGANTGCLCFRTGLIFDGDQARLRFCIDLFAAVAGEPPALDQTRLTMTSPTRSPPRNASPVRASSAPSESPQLPGQPGALHSRDRHRRTAEQAVLPQLPARLAPSLRTSPPRRNTLPPAAEFPPDFEHIFSGTEPLDSEPSRRILETPEGLMEMLGTQSLQQQDDDEIRPVPHAGEASARPPLPVRPTSPQLIDLRQAEIKTKNDRSNINFQNKTLIIIKESACEALQNPTLRQALQAEGIALYTNDLDAQGRLVERERELTPLLEAAANKASTHLAGLSDADMSRLDRAVFMAAIIREQLGQVMAVSNPPGSGESIAPQVSRRLGQPAGSAGKARAISEGGHLHYLTRLCLRPTSDTGAFTAVGAAL